MRFLPRSASWDEEMEKRSRRRIRDLVAHPASQGLDANENRCARISMMARSANAPLKGRIQKRKTNNLQIITSGLQRTAGPYRCAISRHRPCEAYRVCARSPLRRLSAIRTLTGREATRYQFLRNQLRG